MNGERFDRMVRDFATRDGWAISRRSLLRALGLGGAAVTVGSIATETGLHSGALRSALAQDEAPISPAIDELAFTLAYDLDLIFEYVRDQVAYDPYPGMLRGATGTLWGLAGNATDQTMLLAELLRASMVRTRLVEGELSADAANALLDAGALSQEAGKARDRNVFVPVIVEGDASTDTTAVDSEEFAAQFADFTQQVESLIDGHTADGIATITDAMAKAGIVLPDPTPSVPDLERTRHIWLQYANGPEWVDLDPSMPNASPGDVFGENPKVLDAVPAELIHRVAFKLTAEQVAGSDVVRTDLLSYEAPSSDLVGVGMSLVHPQPQALENIGVAISGAIGGFRNFMPSLLVGEETIFGTSVTFGTGEGLLDTLGGGASDGDTLAEWLEITITTPEGQSSISRTVFDRVGEEARAAGTIDPAAVAPVEFVDPDDPNSNFLPLAGCWTFAVVTGDVPESQTARTMPQNPTIDDALPAIHAYHYARGIEAVRQPALAGSRVFVDAPNVTAYVLLPTDVKATTQTAGVALDLLHRSHKVAPGSKASAAGVHPLVASGALAHAVETTMFQSAAIAPLNMSNGGVIGVLQVFEEAKAAGIPTRVITPDGAGDTAPDLPAGPKRLVDEALAAGRIVIIPEKAVEIGGQNRIGWWLVDPATGATIDQMDDGGGSTMTEYVTLLIEVAACITWFIGLAVMLGAFARIVSYSVTESGSGGDIANAGAALGLGGAGAIAGAASCG